MFSFAGTVQEAGAAGRSEAAGTPVRDSLIGGFSLYIASFTFLLVHCGSLVSNRASGTIAVVTSSREGKHHVTKTSSREAETSGTVSKHDPK